MIKKIKKIAKTREGFGCDWETEYQVDIDLADEAGKKIAGRFIVRGWYAHNEYHYESSGSDGRSYLPHLTSGRDLFLVIDKMAKEGGYVNMRFLTWILGGEAEITIQRLKLASDDKVISSSVYLGAGVTDWTYEGPGGRLFYRDRGKTGGLTDGSWYRLNDQRQVCQSLTEEERRSMVS